MERTSALQTSAARGCDSGAAAVAAGVLTAGQRSEAERGLQRLK